MSYRYTIKQYIKTFLHKVILPFVYSLYRRTPVEKGKILFADSNSDSLPESMSVIYDNLKSKNLNIRLYCLDFRKCGMLRILCYLLTFMKDYATAEYVFICNYFLPVTSCKKKAETVVVQLWHSCGLLKKFAYDTEEDISPDYHGNITKNLSLITVSSQACIPVWQKALRLENDQKQIVQATGVSRTDVLFDSGWRSSCIERFHKYCPSLVNKKIVLYAPTFRGTASTPSLIGYDAILELEKELGPEWAVIKKLHPHLSGSDSIPMTSMELFPCADVLITDYSSLLFEFILLDKPFVIFAPDYREYKQSRGLYEDPAAFPGEFVTTKQHLAIAVKKCYARKTEDAYSLFKNYHSGSCDGNSTQRILRLIGLSSEEKQ